MNPIDTYIQTFEPAVQYRLKQIREVILKEAPLASESLSYGMPAYKTNGLPLVYFGAFKHHIGFYATPTGHSAFAEELKPYKQGKGSVQFPYNEPLPIRLIAKMVAFRVKENLEKKK